MKTLFIIILLLSVVILPQDKKLNVIKINEEIRIDGVIDDVWNKADSSDDFFQLAPFYASPPKNRTIVKLLTNESSLYCLFICFQDIKTLKATAGKLDDFTGDVVSLMFDSFNDKRTAYKFGVSASGVRMDARLLDDARNRDYSWDGIWFADSRIYDFGYVIEIEIPYKSIQYDDKLTEWNLDFDRWTNYQKEDLYWNKYEENEGQRISKFGKLSFVNFKPTVKDLNLEIYPVALSKAQYLHDNEYKIKPDIGLDIFYNPSQKLTLQVTANPDFAQIEADPYDFNISRYESYFSERRPFFTQGSEIFMPSGQEHGSGFYSPLELFYPRRIGKKLADGSEVPLYFGSKVFGRLGEYEYGGFIARTGQVDYLDDTLNMTESAAYFGSARIKKQIFDNSSVGILFVGKVDKNNNYGVLDVDGAFRGGDWQLAYQFARSFINEKGDFASSLGFRKFTDSWVYLGRGRFIGNNFDISQIGFVPWKGNVNSVFLTGPRWYFEHGAVRSIMIYFGPAVNYEHEDLFLDYSGVFGFNMQFRSDWGYEINLDAGKAKDNGINYNSYSVNLSSWYNMYNDWSGNIYGGYQKTYNFDRDYLAFYSWMGIAFEYQPIDILELGTSYDMYVEGNPSGNVEDITYNARPYFSITPFNNFNVRLYVDNVYVKSTQHLERIFVGFLLSYNFLPKSWIYLAFNEARDRSEEGPNNNRMHLRDRASVLKVKYLYYF